MTQSISNLRDQRTDELARTRQELIETYPSRWDRMISQWLEQNPDALWLVYGANYLGRTAGQRWAIDPIRLAQRVPEAPDPDLEDLSNLSCVILTHNHRDHCDPPLWRAIANTTEAKWIVPEHMLERVNEETDLPDERLIVAEPLKPIQLGPLCITAFDGLHWEWDADQPAGDPPARGLPATGYLLETQAKRWLFPGDTRTYDRSQLPDFGPVDAVFAHIWLGRSCALMDSPTLLEDFCRFVESLQPRRQVILGHLYDLSRPPKDCWVHEHVSMVTNHLQPRLPNVSIHAPALWEQISI